MSKIENKYYNSCKIYPHILNMKNTKDGLKKCKENNSNLQKKINVIGIISKYFIMHPPIGATRGGAFVFWDLFTLMCMVILS